MRGALSRVAPMRLRVLLVAVTTIVLGIGLAAGETAAASSNQTVTVNLASTTGPVTGAGAGYLYGLSQDGSGPPDYLLAPMNLNSARGGGARIGGDGWIGDGYTAGSGFQARINSALEQARRVETPPYHVTYDLLVSDLYGADTTQPSDTVYPCTSGNCSNWVSFIQTVVDDVEAAGVSVRYDIWNEPDGSAFWAPGYNTTQYYDMWNSAVNEIRSLQPSAVIVGPSVSNFNTTYLSEFLSTVKADGTLPNVLNWHFSGTPIADAQTEENQLATDGITGVSLSMNEYLDASSQNAGQEAWNLTQIAKSGLSSASHAIWSNCCTSENLDGTLTPTAAGR